MRRPWKYSVVFLLLGIASLAIYRNYTYSQIPEGRKNVPFQVVDEEIPIPRRPGTQSIRIVGPPLKLLKFQIDFSQNPIPLDWKFLEQIDKKADVMVEAAVDINGAFSIKKFRDKGHPKAGQYIKKVLSSWKFERYKMGTIKYYFNVPTRMENMKVQIDLRGLRKNFEHITPNDVLKDGLIYYIEGLDRDNVMLIK